MIDVIKLVNRNSIDAQKDAIECPISVAVDCISRYWQRVDRVSIDREFRLNLFNI